MMATMFDQHLVNDVYLTEPNEATESGRPRAFAVAPTCQTGLGLETQEEIQSFCNIPINFDWQQPGDIFDISKDNTMTDTMSAPFAPESPFHESVSSGEHCPTNVCPTNVSTTMCPTNVYSLEEARQVIANMQAIISQMGTRIQELEKQNRERDEIVEDTPMVIVSAHSSPSFIDLSTKVPSPVRMEVQPVPVAVSHSLVMKGDMELLWYADRPYPAFTLQLVNERNEPVLNSQQEVRVSLRDGYGHSCDKLGGPASAQQFVFPVEDDGTVEISQIRFTSVSSKCGGHFQVVAEVTQATDNPDVKSWVSERVQVLSYRLFHQPKLEFEKLQETDSVSKVKGIGSMYAQRFAQLGVATVADLAALNIGDGSELGTGVNCQTILDNLRKVRGALTRPKLVEYVNQAREVVIRCRANRAPRAPGKASRSLSDASQKWEQPPSKRARAAPPAQSDAVFCDFVPPF